MLKLICTFALVFASLNCFADSTAFFGEEKVTILVQGREGDLDAQRLYDMLATEPVDTGTQLRKQVTFTTSTIHKLFEITCSVSKTVAGLGSCTAHIYRSPFTRIDMARNYLHVGVTDAINAGNAVRLFAPPTDGRLFDSRDNHFHIYGQRRDRTIGTEDYFGMEFTPPPQ